MSTTLELAKIEDIKELVGRSWCGLFEGTGCACEAETMVQQTLAAAVTNQRERGKPFSIKGKGVERTRAKCGTDSGTAYHMLLDKDYFVEDEHEGDTVIFMTQKLVDLLRGHLAKKG